MMRALGAGGLRLFCDGVRPPDPFNPHGYFELERVKRLRENPHILDRFAGGAVKVIYALATHLNPARRYHFIVMQRDPRAVLASQNHMLRGLGKTSSPMDAGWLEKEISDFSAWLTQARWVTASYATFELWCSHPLLAAKKLAGSLSYPLDVEAMAASVQCPTPVEP